MAKYRSGGNKDANQDGIVEDMRAVGAKVLILTQVRDAFDVLVAFRGRLHAMEIKNPLVPQHKRKLTKGEGECKRDFEANGVPYNIVLTTNEALNIIFREGIADKYDDAWKQLK